MNQHKTSLKSCTIINRFDIVMYIENLLDLPVSKTVSRFDLAFYLEISVDLQDAWEKSFQDYKQF